MKESGLFMGGIDGWRWSIWEVLLYIYIYIYIYISNKQFNGYHENVNVIGFNEYTNIWRSDHTLKLNILLWIRTIFTISTFKKSHFSYYCAILYENTEPLINAFIQFNWSSFYLLAVYFLTKRFASSNFIFSMLHSSRSSSRLICFSSIWALKNHACVSNYLLNR